MAKVTLVLATTTKPLPAGVSFAGQRLFKLGDAAQIVAGTTVDFDGVADGTYTATCQSLDSTGAPIDDQVTCSVVVQSPAAGTPPSPAPAPNGGTYDAPASLAATVSY